MGLFQIKNIDQKDIVAFKIKATHISHYQARPKCGFIEHNSNVIVNVTISSNAVDECLKEGLNNFHDKFLVQYVNIDDSETGIRNNEEAICAKVFFKYI